MLRGARWDPGVEQLLVHPDISRIHLEELAWQVSHFWAPQEP